MEIREIQLGSHNMNMAVVKVDCTGRKVVVESRSFPSQTLSLLNHNRLPKNKVFT